jgi:flavin reductase (DIM6/NTAB) family NADH-FMN oxidoreductase RutF
MAGTHSPIDPMRYREVMGHYPTGVTVVTGTAEDGSPVGMVVGTFTSVSLSPPLVAFLPTTSSQTFARLRTAAAYCINVLAHDQVDLCRAMAGSGPDKFAGVGWRPSGLGAPMLSDAVAHIHCLPQRIIEAGDHYIALCEVRAMDVNRQVTPLLFFQGGYGGFSPHGMTAGGDAELITGIRLADLARPQIDQLARELGCEAAVLVAVNDTELTTAATAHGGGAQLRHLLGERLPMKPPLGEAYVAWAPQAVIERWLAKAGKDPELVASYRRRLESLRGQGYAASLIGPDGAHYHDRLAELRDQYAAGGLTPAAERALLAQMAELMTNRSMTSAASWFPCGTPAERSRCSCGSRSCRGTRPGAGSGTGSTGCAPRRPLWRRNYAMAPAVTLRPWETSGDCPHDHESEGPRAQLGAGRGRRHAGARPGITIPAHGEQRRRLCAGHA